MSDPRLHGLLFLDAAPETQKPRDTLFLGVPLLMPWVIYRNHIDHHNPRIFGGGLSGNGFGNGHSFVHVQAKSG